MVYFALMQDWHRFCIFSWFLCLIVSRVYLHGLHFAFHEACHVFGSFYCHCNRCVSEMVHVVLIILFCRFELDLGLRGGQGSWVEMEGAACRGVSFPL